MSQKIDIGDEDNYLFLHTKKDPLNSFCVSWLNYDFEVVKK